MTTTIDLGRGPTGVASVDLDILLRSRLLIQANSGGGKSWLLRRLAEQLFGKVPTIIVDPEGEFATLRERLDFVLVGKGGETPAYVPSAGQLAHKLLELGASAVCDLFEMGTEERHDWVAAFLDGLVDAPKHLWRPLVVMVDEAHLFAPEKGAGDSSAVSAMLSLATRGRKRGYCAIYATQRLGKLRKDAAAELQNVLIGQTFIDLDRERAAEALGMPRARRSRFFDEVKTMPPGRFFGFGRAISTEPILVRVGGVATTHPEPGSAKHAAEPPPAPAKIRHLLPQLADLSREAEAQAALGPQQGGGLAREVSRLRAQLEHLRRHPPKPTVERIPFIPPRVTDGLAGLEQQLAATLELVQGLRRFGGEWSADVAAQPKPARSPATRPPRPARAAQEPSPPTASPPAPNGDLPRGARDILAALAARHPHPLTRSQLATLASMAPTGGTLRTYLSKLSTTGLLRKEGDGFALTELGLTTTGPIARASTSAELVAMWRRKLTGKAKDLLELFAAERGPFDREPPGRPVGPRPKGGDVPHVPQ